MEPAEQIAEARERRNGAAAEEGGDGLNSTAAIIIAVMAMLLAITSLGGGNAAEDIMNHNIHASDTWAFYQAKNIRQTAYRLAADELESELQMQSATPEARQGVERRIQQYRETAARYEDEPDPSDPSNPLRGEGKKQLTARARDFEAQRDRAQAQDPNFDFAEALFQIAIVLASVAILAASRRILWASVAVGALAAVLMLNGYFLFFELPF